jgi:hypothetical protein
LWAFNNFILNVWIGIDAVITLFRYLNPIEKQIKTFFNAIAELNRSPLNGFSFTLNRMVLHHLVNLIHDE